LPLAEHRRSADQVSDSTASPSHEKGGKYRVKLLKILIVPAVLLFSVVMAAPAFAHHLNNATITEAQCQNGRVCVTLAGDVAPNTDERHVFIGIFAKGSPTQKLDEIKFVVPKNSGNNPISMPPDTECFKALPGDSSASFTLKVMRVTLKDDTTLADLTITVASSHQVIVFNGNDEDQPVAIEKVTLTQCLVQTSPSPSPSPSPSASASAATTTTTLANTGGFDFRFPLIGLILLVAGGTLYVIGASRGRSRTK
jgi:hypothetical protein